MQKLRMLAADAGPNGCFPVGAERIVGDVEAKLLIEGGYAELLESITDETAEAESSDELVEDASAVVGSPDDAEAPSTDEASQGEPEPPQAAAGKHGGKRGRKK